MNDWRGSNLIDARTYHGIAYELGCRLLEEKPGVQGLFDGRHRPHRMGSECLASIHRLRIRAGGREKLYRLALAELAMSRVEAAMRFLLLLIESDRPYPPALLLGGLLAWVEGETWMAENCFDSYILAVPDNDIGWLMIETVYARGDPAGVLARTAGADQRPDSELRHTARVLNVAGKWLRPGN